ncbi:hypothetical protein [Salinisphaera hydrothermalis]|uniref:hypothetical protein n=1 Tax=Salinisphaera hydrothermalis TaxID=563188 RepID=UPI00333EB7F9
MHYTTTETAAPDPVRTLRPARQVMQLPRLGSLFQTRLSFTRSLVRQMLAERWQIETQRFALDDEGYGEAVYRIQTPGGIYSFVLFSRYLDPALRSDRVIAQQWDLAFALCEGELMADDIEQLAANVPRQEAGRCSARVLTLSRANRSQRNFNAVIDRLAVGRQPDIAWFESVGYLYRTTAVYGNGKFGLADYDRLRSDATFGRPFSAQMFTVFMVREFTLTQVEHIARRRAPATAVTLVPELKRYIGIGNSTGLGMAPFLISHPQLIDRWITQRETALACALAHTPDRGRLKRLTALIERAITHMRETRTDDTEQASADQRTMDELVVLQRWLAARRETRLLTGWRTLVRHAERRWSLQTQELLNSLLMELYPAAINPLEDDMTVEDPAPIDSSAPLGELRELIETRYAWALAYDFSDPQAQHYFWYRAAAKEEPRLGQRARDIGAEREIGLDVARAVRRCYDAVCQYSSTTPEADVIDFVLAHPAHRAAVRRVQNLGPLPYGDIRANLLGHDCRPLDLLRCKLSFFGASKFDPRSDRWVRITLFQGAPLAEDLADAPVEYDWFLPVSPVATMAG